jgi:hypothetical protein
MRLPKMNVCFMKNFYQSKDEVANGKVCEKHDSRLICYGLRFEVLVIAPYSCPNRHFPPKTPDDSLQIRNLIFPNLKDIPIPDQVIGLTGHW